MNFKKTITISVMFHICLFSAALLFSSGLLKGSGNNGDEEVFFVKLTKTEDSRNAEMEVPGKDTVPAAKPAIKVKAMQEQRLIKTKEPASPVQEELKSVEEDPLEKLLPAVKAKEEIHVASVKTGSIVNDSNEADVYHNRDQYSGDDINDLYEMLQASNRTEDNLKLSGGNSGNALSPGIMELIGSAIERVKTYPVMARKRGIEGTVHVSFVISPEGSPQDITVMKSSGFSILDRATVQVVKKAAPYPVVASRIEVPIAYKLRR
jgi:TonB family protein